MKKRWGKNIDTGKAGIVGVIFTLEHARGLVAGRSCSIVAEHWNGKP